MVEEYVVKHGKKQGAQMRKSGRGAGERGGLADEALETVVGGLSSATAIESRRGDASADIQPRPLNEVLGKVRRFDRA